MTIFRLMPADGSAPRVLIFVLHGVGSDAASMQQLAQVLHKTNANAVVVTPDAPVPFDAGGSGYQWFSIRGIGDHNRQTRIADAMPRIAEIIEQELVRYRLTRNNLGVCGFSQGAMMALSMTDAANSPAAIASIAGRIARPVRLALANPSRLFLTHGESDPIVPFNCMSEAVSAFSNAGYPLASLPIPRIGHQIAIEQAEAVSTFFQGIFQTTGIEQLA